MANNKATRATDRRKHGRARRVPGVVAKDANLQDQRKAGAYSPNAPTTRSEFTVGVNVGKPMSRGVAVGKGANRTMSMPKKLGEK